MSPRARRRSRPHRPAADRPPRILHVVGGSEFGGASLLIIELCLAARAAGMDVAVLTTNRTFQERLAAAGVHLIDLDVIRRPIRPWWDAFGLMRLTRFLRAEPFDLVHTHTSKAGFVGRRAAWRAGVPVIVHTVHGLPFHEFSSRGARVIYVWLERLASRWCDLIVTVTNHHREVALANHIGSPDRVVAIPNGIAPLPGCSKEEREAVRGSLGLTGTDFALLVVGRLAPGKGVEHLIDAIVSFPDPSPILLVAGSGPSRQDLEARVARLGLGDRVRFVGFREDVALLLAAADLVVLPSLHEGLSIALLEAMAARRPVLTTSIPGNCEATRNGEGAELVPPDDARALAAAIARLQKDPARREALAGRAQEIFEASYTRERMLAEYRSWYRRLLAEALADQRDDGATQDA